MNEEKETRNLNEEHPEEAGSEPRQAAKSGNRKKSQYRRVLSSRRILTGSRSLQNLQTVRN